MLLLRAQLTNIINKETDNIVPIDLIHIIIEYVSSIYVENLLAPKWKDNQSFVCIPNDTIYCKYSVHAYEFWNQILDIDGEFCYIPRNIEKELCHGHQSRVPLPLDMCNSIKNNNIIFMCETTKLTQFININCSRCDFYNSFACGLSYDDKYKTFVIVLDIYTSSLKLIIF